MTPGGREAAGVTRHTAGMRWAVVLVSVLAGCAPTGSRAPTGASRAALTIDPFSTGVSQVQEASGYQFSPAVARSGDTLFVAWSDGRFGTGTQYRTMGTRLLVDGGRLDPVSVAVSGPETQFGSGQSIGVLNGEFLIAWHDDGPYTGWFRRLRPDGTFLEPPRRLHAVGESTGPPFVSAAPDHALLAWPGFGGLPGVGLAVLWPDGGLATPAGGVRLPAGSTTRLTGGWLGNRHRLAWAESFPDGGTSLIVATVAFDGGLSFQNHGVLTSGAVTDPLFAVDRTGRQQLSWLSRSGALFSFAAFDFTDTTWLANAVTSVGAGTRLLATIPGVNGLLSFVGTSTDAGDRVTVLELQGMSQQLQANFSVGSVSSFAATPLDPGEVLAIVGASSSLRATSWTTPGAPGATTQVVPLSLTSQRGSSAAPVDGGFLVAWSDARSSRPGVFVATVAQTPALSPPGGANVRGGSLYVQDTTSMASAPGGAWLLVHERRPVLLQLDAAGSVISSPRLFAPADVVLPVVSLTGGGVAWATSVGLAPGAVSWLDASGSVRSVVLPSSALFQRSLASTGSRLITSEPGGFLWIDLDGGVSDGGRFSQAFADVSTVWSGPGHALHVQHTATGLLLRRIREDGVWLDAAPVPMPVDAGSVGTQRVVATWSGAGWDVLVNGAASRSSEHLSVPLVGAPRAVRAYGFAATALASDSQGRLLITRDEPDESPAVMANRVQFVLVSEGARGSACSAAADCASGFCVGGMCCDQACAGGCATCRAGGAVPDGVCTPLPPTRVCRAAARACDADETCDGVSLSCPVDQPAPLGTPCPGGVCVAAVCVAVPDAGAADAGLDAGLVDGGASPDAGADGGVGLVDGGSDAGLLPVDGGASADAGPDDGGAPVDAGTPDAGALDGGGQADAGTTDGGLLPDAGALDGGGPVDAGPARVAVPSEGRFQVGTGCAQGSGQATALWAVLVAMGVLRRRRP